MPKGSLPGGSFFNYVGQILPNIDQLPPVDIKVKEFLYFYKETIDIMAIRVVEFSNGGYKVRKINLPKGNY